MGLVVDVLMKRAGWRISISDVLYIGQSSSPSSVSSMHVFPLDSGSEGPASICH